MYTHRIDEHANLFFLLDGSLLNTSLQQLVILVHSFTHLTHHTQQFIPSA